MGALGSGDCEADGGPQLPTRDGRLTLRNTNIGARCSGGLPRGIGRHRRPTLHDQGGRAGSVQLRPPPAQRRGRHRPQRRPHGQRSNDAPKSRAISRRWGLREGAMATAPPSPTPHAGSRAERSSQRRRPESPAPTVRTQRADGAAERRCRVPPGRGPPPARKGGLQGGAIGTTCRKAAIAPKWRGAERTQSTRRNGGGCRRLQAEPRLGARLGGNPPSEFARSSMRQDSGGWPSATLLHRHHVQPLGPAQRSHPTEKAPRTRPPAHSHRRPWRPPRG